MPRASFLVISEAALPFGRVMDVPRNGPIPMGYERTCLPSLEEFSESLEHYAKEGRLNLIAAVYLGNLLEICLSSELNARFESAMRTALGVCAKEGNLDAISSFMESEVLPASAMRRLEPAVFTAMRASFRNRDYDSIRRFLIRSGKQLSERESSKGLSYLVRAHAFAQVRDLLREGSLPPAVREKAQRAHMRFERGLERLAWMSYVLPPRALVKPAKRPKPARPATSNIFLLPGRK